MKPVNILILVFTPFVAAFVISGVHTLLFGGNFWMKLFLNSLILGIGSFALAIISVAIILTSDKKEEENNSKSDL